MSSTQDGRSFLWPANWPELACSSLAAHRPGPAPTKQQQTRLLSKARDRSSCCGVMTLDEWCDADDDIGDMITIDAHNSVLDVGPELMDPTVRLRLLRRAEERRHLVGASNQGPLETLLQELEQADAATMYRAEPAQSDCEETISCTESSANGEVPTERQAENCALRESEDTIDAIDGTCSTTWSRGQEQDWDCRATASELELQESAASAECDFAGEASEQPAVEEVCDCDCDVGTDGEAQELPSGAKVAVRQAAWPATLRRKPVDPSDPHTWTFEMKIRVFEEGFVPFAAVAAAAAVDEQKEEIPIDEVLWQASLVSSRGGA